jgi:aminopeptidase YwaD
MKLPGFILPIFLIFLTTSFLQAQTEFSQENATQILRHLSVDIGPRTMGSPAEWQALNYAAEKFKEYGCDTAYIMKIGRFSHGNTNSGVAVGIKRGITKRIIVIGGHIDSAEPEIPGADDDGSGSAVVIEATHVFGKRQMQSTIVFCCFGGEEQGLIGSKHFVSSFPDIDSVVMMLQIDMANGLGILDMDPNAHKSSSAPKWLVSAAVEEYNNLGYKHLRYSTHFNSLNYSLTDGPGSDHEPFLQKGIPAIAFISDVSKPIHTPRDNFENFDQAGLKRSGDIIVKLVERFDQGVPSRNLETYWLYLLWDIPVFIPVWGLWIFISLVLVLTISAFIAARKRREPVDLPARIRWSGIKMFLFSIIIVTCGWFSPDLVGWIKGNRFPWIGEIGWYYLLAAIAMSIGGWIVLRISLRLKLSQCPYVHFKRAVIILLVILVTLWFANLKLVVEPGIALLFISLAILVRKPILKLIFIALSPWWMIRLIFSEWGDALLNVSTNISIPVIVKLFLNAGVILIFSVYILPFLFAITAVIKDSIPLNLFIVKLRSRTTFIVLTAFFVGLSCYLFSIPRFNSLWYRNVEIAQEYNMSTGVKTISVKGSEYLDGLKIESQGGDSLIGERITSMDIKPETGFDTSWVSVTRQEQKHRFHDTTHSDIELTLRAKSRPYTVSVTYSIAGKEMNAFDTPWQFRTNKSGKNIYWYSFPDSVLTIPVKFSTIGNDSVKENIEVVFDKLAYPIKVEGKMTDVIPRTKYTAKYSYMK